MDFRFLAQRPAVISETAPGSSKAHREFESPCILSDESQTREKLRRGRPFSPESLETVAEQGRHAPKRQVRARTVARDSQARIAPQGREKPGGEETGGGGQMVEQVVVGIDVSKAKLDVALLPGGEQFRVSNDLPGIGELLRRGSPLGPSRGGR